jgi:hypothetical protein
MGVGGLGGGPGSIPGSGQNGTCRGSEGLFRGKIDEK